MIKNKKIILSILTIFVALSVFNVAYAQTGKFSGYLTKIYKFGLAAAIFLAVLMIVIGGITYMLGSANISNKEKGRKFITDALLGLLLALGSWLILYTINPDLVGNGLTVPVVKLKILGNKDPIDLNNKPHICCLVKKQASWLEKIGLDSGTDCEKIYLGGREECEEKCDDVLKSSDSNIYIGKFCELKKIITSK